MNSFEANKIIGAVLGTLVFVMGVGFIADEIYAPIEGHGAGYALPEPTAEGEAGVVEEASVAPIAARMQTASAEAGADLIVRCQSCHDYSSANENKVGPGLFNVVGRPIASHGGFAYSDALVALSADGAVWDYEHLDGFLESPRDYAPGTKMTFAGLSDPQDRADLIAFLRENSDDPFPLPEAPAETAAPAEDAAVEGAADQGEAPAEPDPLIAAMAAVTPEDGEALIVRCQACHDYSEANTNRVGPGLHGVVGRPIASHPDFSYSDALASLGAAGEIWTPQNLSAFLEKPSDFAPGTKMSFPGLADIEDRAALIVYLNSIAETPIDLGGGAVPAEGEAAPAEQPAVEGAEAPTPEGEAAVEDGEATVTVEAPQTETDEEAGAEVPQQ